MKNKSEIIKVIKNKLEVIEVIKWNNEYFEVGDIVVIERHTHGSSNLIVKGKIIEIYKPLNPSDCFMYGETITLDTSDQYNANKEKIELCMIHSIKKI